jgi:uncharacterized protein YccT (UPF0319 family)
MVFDDDQQSISSIQVQYPMNPSMSFEIKNNLLFDEKHIQIAVDSNRIKHYLNSFKGLYHEAYLDFATPAQIDSIKNLSPFCSIWLARKNKQQTRLRLYFKKADKRTKSQFDENNQPNETDPERFWGIIDDDAELVSIQTFNFGKIIKTKLDLTN